MASIRSTFRFTSAAAALLVLGGCATATHLAAPDTPFTGPMGALQCSTMHNPGQDGTIGPGGGTLVADRHTLTIPAGALEKSVSFSFRHPPRDYIVVQALPSGTQFARPATITLSYEHCNDKPHPDSIQIWGWPDSSNRWYRIPSKRVQGQSAVQAEIGHFTSFALGST